MKARFLSGDPCVKFDRGQGRRDLAINTQLITLEWGDILWQVPPGFVTDGASIPRVLWPMIGHPFESEIIRGAMIHDYYYAKWAGTGADGANEARLRGIADQVLRAALLADGVQPWRAGLIYRGVRLGGWHAWNRHAAGKRS